MEGRNTRKKTRGVQERCIFAGAEPDPVSSPGRHGVSMAFGNQIRFHRVYVAGHYTAYSKAKPASH